LPAERVIASFIDTEGQTCRPAHSLLRAGSFRGAESERHWTGLSLEFSREFKG